MVFGALPQAVRHLVALDSGVHDIKKPLVEGAFDRGDVRPC